MGIVTPSPEQLLGFRSALSEREQTPQQSNNHDQPRKHAEIRSKQQRHLSGSGSGPIQSAAGHIIHVLIVKVFGHTRVQQCRLIGHQREVPFVRRSGVPYRV